MKLAIPPKLCRLRPPLPLAALIAALGSASAFAQETAKPAAVEHLTKADGDIVWLILTAVLVFFMQAGFAMVETGMTRAKNACNIMMKNLLDFVFGALAFWAIGYCLMYGDTQNGLIGWTTSLVGMESATNGASASSSASWLFQVVFAATAATIVSGALAERTKFVSYIIYSIAITTILYPVTGHWIWGTGGWLNNLGMRDFAGSTVVHCVGGWSALAALMLMGPRIGKFDAQGRSLPIPGHNLPLATLGVFILWFGWYGFNCGSTLAITGGLAHVAVTTTLGACGGAAAATLTSWLKFGKPDLTFSLNGTLAGLVAITAPCASVSSGAAIAIGAIGGILVVYSCVFVENRLKIDDPVGAISVHGVCGLWGTLAVGLFGQNKIDALFWPADKAIKDGAFYGGGFSQFGVQLSGAVAVFVYTMVVIGILFYILRKTVGIRVSAAEEEEGLDIGEHGNEAYPELPRAAGGSYTSTAPATPPAS